MESITIGETPVGEGYRPFVIAEIGTNYRDDLDLAKAMVDEAGGAGADAAKFQTHLAAAEMVKTEMSELGFGDLYDRIGSYEMSVDEHRDLRDRCHDHDMEFLSTPFSVEAVDVLEEVGVPAYKIGSGELTNYHLLKRVSDTDKPMLVSTGMADWETVEDSVSFLREHADEFALMYCVSEYPTDAEDFNLGVIDKMKDAFDVPVGFSDHSRGIEAAVTAMARGADFVEKHFTLDRRLPGGDQEVSIEPEELTELTRYADLIHQTRGSERGVRDAEESLSKWAHHSVVVSDRVDAGETFTSENLTTKRPGVGLPANRYFDILGATAATALGPDTVLRESDVNW